MDAIPVPELVAAALISLVFLGIRAVVRRSPLGSVLGQDAAPVSRPPLPETERLRVRLIASCVMIGIISIPLILRLVPPNGSYGFRIHATQTNRAVWYAANAFMGWAMLTASALCAALLVGLPARTGRSMLWATFFGSIFAAVAAATLYVTQLS